MDRLMVFLGPCELALWLSMTKPPKTLGKVDSWLLCLAISCYFLFLIVCSPFCGSCCHVDGDLRKRSFRKPKHSRCVIICGEEWWVIKRITRPIWTLYNIYIYILRLYIYILYIIYVICIHINYSNIRSVVKPFDTGAISHHMGQHPKPQDGSNTQEVSPAVSG